MSDVESEIEEVVTWLEDGHHLIFRLEQDNVYIFNVICPFDGKAGLCNTNRDRCIIDTFIQVYGVEINIGSTNIDGPVEIAWSPILGQCDLDSNIAQIWVIPVDDKEYQAYKILNNL